MGHKVDGKSIPLCAPSDTTCFPSVLAWSGARQSAATTRKGMTNVIVIWPNNFINYPLRLLDKEVRIVVSLKGISFSIGK